MRWPIIKLIFFREARDQLRDRRTLFMIIALPVMLYPALGLGLIQLTLQFRQEERRVGIVGADHLPDSPPLFTKDKDRFDADLFTRPKNQNYYLVVPSDHWTREDLLAGRIDVLVIVPTNASQLLADGKQLQVEVFRNGINDNSEIAYRATIHCLETWGDKLAAQRLQQIGKSVDFARPIKIDEEVSDISLPESRSGTAWGKFFPFLIVMMTLTGAFYPAIDMCAGEKERGTMETLLITPAARSEIVMGKFLAILLFSVATTVFNLASMGLTFGQISHQFPETSGLAERFSPPSVGSVMWMLVLMLPLAAFFSALCMALAIFARSTKEGQYYLMPTFLIVTPLIFITLAPGVELTTFYSLVPVTNVALLLRALMLNQYEKAMVYLVPVLAPTILYSFLALRFAIEQFNREDVLFREAERFELGLWIRHMLRDKEPTPSSSQAWFCYVLILLLIWYSQGRLAPTLDAQAVVHLAFIGFPPVLMALLLTSQPRRTLLLRAPALLPAAIALLAVVAIHPVALSLGMELQKLFPVSDQIQSGMRQLLTGVSFERKLIVLAVIPAICEEIAFRGFILSGLLRKYSPAQAILISSILFGVIHMITPQMIMATLLGIVLAIIATRSGSIFPGMVFHVIHNGWMLWTSQRLQEQSELAAGAMPEPYPLAIVTSGALATALLIGFLASRPALISPSQPSPG